MLPLSSSRSTSSPSKSRSESVRKRLSAKEKERRLPRISKPMKERRGRSSNSFPCSRTRSSIIMSSKVPSAQWVNRLLDKSKFSTTTPRRKSKSPRRNYFKRLLERFKENDAPCARSTPAIDTSSNAPSIVPSRLWFNLIPSSGATKSGLMCSRDVPRAHGPGVNPPSRDITAPSKCSPPKSPSTSSLFWERSSVPKRMPSKIPGSTPDSLLPANPKYRAPPSALNRAPPCHSTISPTTSPCQLRQNRPLYKTLSSGIPNRAPSNMSLDK